MIAARDLFKPTAQTEESKMLTGAPVIGAFSNPQQSNLLSDFSKSTGGSLMPTIPPLNLSMATSSESKTGAQTGGGFVSHGINFGTSNALPSGTNWLLIGAVAVAVFVFARKK